MRKLILGLCFYLPFVSLSGQFRYGVRAGVNSDRIKLLEYTSNDQSLKVTIPENNYMGYHVGLISQFKVYRFFAQPELLFSTHRNDVVVTTLEGVTRVTRYDENIFNKLNIPVYFGYKNNTLKLGAGMVGSMLLRSKSDLLESKGIIQNLNNLTFGYQIGAGLDIGKLAIDFKYEGSLQKFGDGLMINQVFIPFDQQTKQLIFSVGFLF